MNEQMWKLADIAVKILTPLIVTLLGFLFGAVIGLQQDVEVIKSNRFTASDAMEMQRRIEADLETKVDRLVIEVEELKRCTILMSNGRTCDF